MLFKMARFEMNSCLVCFSILHIISVAEIDVFEFDVENNYGFSTIQGSSIALQSKSNRECIFKCLKYHNGKCCDAEFDTYTMKCYITIDNRCRTNKIVSPGRNAWTRRRKYVGLTVSNGGQLGDWSSALYCPRGQFGIGYKLRIEGGGCHDCGAADGVEIICATENGTRTGTTLTSNNNNLMWGELTDEIMCPHGTFMTSFSLKVDPYRGYRDSYDDTAVNNIMFQCRKFNVMGTHELFMFYNDEKGTYGDWSNSCDLGFAICGIEIRYQGYQGLLKDDTTLNDVKFYCCN